MVQTHFTAVGTCWSRLSVAAAILLLMAVGMPQRCIAQNRHPQIFVGSAFGLNQMLDRSRWPYVAANADGFYNHTWGWSPPRTFPNHYPPFTAADQKKLVANFTHKSALLEGGLDSSQSALPTSHGQPVRLGLRSRAAVARAGVPLRRAVRPHHPGQHDRDDG